MKQQEITKQEVIDALTKLVLLIMFFFCNAIFSQDINGEYYQNLVKPNGNHFTGIVFNENQEFHYSEYELVHGNKVKEGYGHYTINKNKLKLNFDLTSSKMNSKKNIIRKENIRDSVIVAFEVTRDKYEDYKPISGGFLLYMDKDKQEHLLTNKEGKASIKFLKSDHEYAFDYISLGLPKFSVTIKSDMDYLIKMEIDMHEADPVEDKIMVFKIKKLRKNYIVLKRPKEKKVKLIKKN